MKISIIINNYNYARFLRDAIDSALGQTWPDCEVIVVDDGSTDGSRDVIESYGAAVKALFQENQGQGCAITSGFAVCSGDGVILLDSDDALYPHTAAEAAKALTNKPGLARVQWPLQTVDASKQSVGSLTPNPSMMASGDLSSHILQFRTHVWPPTSGSAYSAAILRELMPVPAEFRWACDLYLAETTALLGDVLSLSQPGGIYRVHGKNGWTRSAGERSLPLSTTSSSGRSGPGSASGYLLESITRTVDNHKYVRRVAEGKGLECPIDPGAALDVAFIQQRLAHLRLNPSGHPFPTDRRLGLTSRGVWAAIRHPHHSRNHKIKRAAWISAVGLGPRWMTERLVNRFYFRPFGR